MSEMIERVARAIEAAALKAGEGSLAAGKPQGLSEIMATAAIAAMREPTERMNFAGQAVGDYPWDGRKPSRIFTAMIDEALK